MKYLMLLAICVSATAYSKNSEYSVVKPEVYEIVSVITKLHPILSRKDALQYATIVNRYAIEYDVEWQIAVAIFSQESSFQIDAVNWASKDYGIGQMSHKNVQIRKISLARLLNDPDYAIQESFRLLYELKTNYNTNAKGHWRWYTRYHSYTPKHRKIYFRYLNKKMKTIRRLSNEYKKATKRNPSNSGREAWYAPGQKGWLESEGFFGEAWDTYQYGGEFFKETPQFNPRTS